MKEIHPVALFRYSVLGPLVSRGHLERGELKTIIRELAARPYDRWTTLEIAEHMEISTAWDGAERLSPSVPA